MKLCVMDINKLANSNDWFDRLNAAGYSFCPNELLMQLSDDYSYSVRENVAGNSRCPIYILEKLSFDDTGLVLHNIIGNTNCPPELSEAVELARQIKYGLGWCATR